MVNYHWHRPLLSDLPTENSTKGIDLQNVQAKGDPYDGRWVYFQRSNYMDTFDWRKAAFSILLIPSMYRSVFTVAGRPSASWNLYGPIVTLRRNSPNRHFSHTKWAILMFMRFYLSPKTHILLACGRDHWCGNLPRFWLERNVNRTKTCLIQFNSCYQLIF